MRVFPRCVLVSVVMNELRVTRQHQLSMTTHTRVWGEVLLSIADIQNKEDSNQEVSYGQEKRQRKCTKGRMRRYSPLHCIEKLAHQSNREATCLCLESLSNTQPCCSGRDTENRVREAAHYAELELWLPLTLSRGHTTRAFIVPPHWSQQAL